MSFAQAFSAKHGWLIFLFLFTSCAHSPATKNEDSSWLSTLGLRTHLAPSWKITRRHESQMGAGQLTVVELKNPNGLSLALRSYKMTSISAAQDMQAQKIALLSSVYDARIDPYFAVITKQTSCPNDFLPKTESVPKNGSNLLLVSAYANERNTIGACTEDLVRSRAYFAFLTCGPVFTQVEKFVPLPLADASADQVELRSIDCLH